MKFLSFLLGNPNDKVIADLQQTVEQINLLEQEIKALSDADLKLQTVKLKQKLADGATLDDILPEAFATAREASYRVLGQRHFDVQLMGGVVLHRGQIAEMKTGEGKTLTAVAPLYLNALAGQGAHLVTVNDYLARIHADQMGRVYSFLGLTVGCIGQQNLSYRFNPDAVAKEGDDQLDVQYLEICNRRDAYACDILYGTNNEFGFDYLRDNMVGSLADMVQRDLSFAIVDEVDSILIDEARTPLIISAPDMESTDKYQRFSQIVKTLSADQDYTIDEKMRTSILTEAGIAKVENALHVDNLYTDAGLSDVHHLEQALKAQVLFKIDRDYVVKEGEIIIVDEFTGRMMHGRRYSEGLHQAIEAKEGVKVQRESRTMATISFQNYFRLYTKLAGMTGTAATEAEEFSKIYNLDVVSIPTNRSLVRQDLNDRIYKNETGKYEALVREVKERHQTGQPILIGTISIEKNEVIADLLARAGVQCQVLNAKQHDREAHIIAQAGRVGTVTVATNMAGRGVDIILGGYPFDKAEHEKVLTLGGLCVIGTERHESRRIDNQLRGRAGRQGDAGASQFYISMDDDLMRVFGSERMKSVMTTLGVPDDMPIENKMISKSIEQAQKKVEGHNFDIRKHLVEYDDVMNKQRETIYRKRRDILSGVDTKNEVIEAINGEIESVVTMHTSDEDDSQWELEKIYEAVNGIFPLTNEQKKKLDEIEDEAGDAGADHIARQKLVGYLKRLAVESYNQLEERINLIAPPDQTTVPMRQIERGLFLRVIDSLWVDHLDTMQYLRTSIGLRGYGQRDPLVEYKREALGMFRTLLSEIDRQVSYSIYKVGLINPQQIAQVPTVNPVNLQLTHDNTEAFETEVTKEEGVAKRSVDQIVKDTTHYDGAKVGRNESCPCGSGKKFKNCHGA